MPFEASVSDPSFYGRKNRSIAVIGAGISGMGAAHRLADNHQVTLFEAGHRLGGHARTVMAGKNGDQPVDTGFIVFNYANYPHLAALFKELAKGISDEGFEEIIAVDNKDISCRLFEGSAEDSESKWVLVFKAMGEAGVVEMNGELDPAFLNSLSNLNFDKVKDLIETGIDIDEEAHMEESYEVDVDI